MKIQVYLKFIILFFFLGSTKETIKPIEPNIIPKPLSQKITDGFFILDENVNLISTSEVIDVSKYFEMYLKETYQVKFSTKKSGKKMIFGIGSINNSRPRFK